MKHLSLHGVEEGFNEGVVGDLAWAVHALREAQLGKAFLEGTSGILGAPIGVEFEAATGLTAPHGAIERFEGELHILPGAIAPTDHAPAVLVHDHRQEAVDRADLEVSDIADPHLVGALELKIELLVGNCTEEALNARARVAQSSHARFDRVATLRYTSPSIQRSEEHTSELQSHSDLVCRLLLEKKKKIKDNIRKRPVRRMVRE